MPLLTNLLRWMTSMSLPLAVAWGASARQAIFVYAAIFAAGYLAHILLSYLAIRARVRESEAAA